MERNNYALHKFLHKFGLRPKVPFISSFITLPEFGKNFS
jgi:hypothetical protein